MILYVSFDKESAIHNLIYGDYERRELVCQISEGVYGFIWEAGLDSEDLYDEVEEIKAAHGYTQLTVIHAPLGAAQLEFLQEGLSSFFMVKYELFKEETAEPKTEEPSSPKVKPVTSAGDPARQERSRLLSLCQIDKSWEPLDCTVNVVLIPMADPAVVDEVVNKGGEAPIYPWPPTQEGFFWESDLILVIFEYCLEWQGTEWAVNPTKVNRDLYIEILETEFLVFEPRLVNFPN